MFHYSACVVMVACLLLGAAEGSSMCRTSTSTLHLRHHPILQDPLQTKTNRQYHRITSTNSISKVISLRGGDFQFGQGVLGVEGDDDERNENIQTRRSSSSSKPNRRKSKSSPLSSSSRKKKKKKKKKDKTEGVTNKSTNTSSYGKVNAQQLPKIQESNEQESYNFDDHCDNDDHHDHDLATIKAILLPRKLSIPHLIRLVSAFLFTSSLLECVRTSGTPFHDAILSTLKFHGMPTTQSGKISPMDVYWAKKLSQADKNILPPTYLPSSIPLLGLVASLTLYIGLTMLFPKWFVEWNVFLNYRRVDVARTEGEEINGNGNGNGNAQKKDAVDPNLQIINYYLMKGGHHNEDKMSENEFYQSQFVNRPYRSSAAENYTGLEVLVKLSQRDQDMASDESKLEDIQCLYRSETDDHPAPYYIELGQRRVYCHIDVNDGIDRDRNNRNGIHVSCMDGGPSFSNEENLKNLLSRGSRGLSNQDELQYARTRYAKYNDLSLPIPTVREAFLERLSSPLAVLQLIGRVLTALEEKFLPAFLNILKNLSQHYINARRSIASAKDLSSEICANVKDQKEEKFWTLRPSPSSSTSTSSWQPIKASDILPGDVFYLPSRDFTMPVDAILLEGTCVAQEAVITGESVPQAKVPLEANDSSEKLSIETNHRNSALFAGTSIIVNNADRFETDSKLPDALRKGSSPIKCLSLKTGTYSSKGEIMRALSKSSHAGSIVSKAGERDSIYLIASLSFFAVIACASVFVPLSLPLPGQGTTTGSSSTTPRHISGFRRVIQCTRILVASIPSELPLALSTIFHTCATTLRKEADVVCSEPGSLLSASHIDMVVFDKTGTLTSDTQAMTEIVNPISPLQPMSTVVLAGCHSLSSLKDGKKSKIIGDPLDIASLDYSGWVFNSNNKSAFCVPKSAGEKKYKTKSKAGKRLWQIKMFPFDPTRRCSYALLLVQHEDDSFKLWKVAKGSTDSVRSLLRTNGDSTFQGKYDLASEKIGSEGKRIVALTAQDVTHSRLKKVLFPKGLPRASMNRNGKLSKRIKIARELAHAHLNIDNFQRSAKGSMEFLGFGCFDASIRPSTSRVIRGIRSSGTKVCMLTGDSCAAALAVAKEAQFFPQGCKTVAVLDITEEKKIMWKIASEKKDITFKPFDYVMTESILRDQEKGKVGIMMTGLAFEAILTQEALNKSASKHMLNHLDKVSVISRSSPRIKQQVLSVLQSKCGRNVMMCGDGVNDISAMKTADTSAALLNGYGSEGRSTDLNVDVENERRKEQAKMRSRRNGSAGDLDLGRARIKKKLDEVLLHSDGKNQKDAFSSISQLMKDEYKRARDLQKGGAAAARILQKEEVLRKSIISKTKNGESSSIENKDLEVGGDMTSIKPGEASLAAAFTFLRPCIDGADTIIRVCVAAAAFSISVHRSIALNSLMACYNLATLYRDGFRYGDHMWNIELAFILAMDKGNIDISCLPRPKIPLLRPSASIFNPSDAISVLLQAIIHLFVLSKGVHGAKLMQQKHEVQGQGGNLRIRLARSALGGNAESILSTTEIGQQGRNFLGRTPFRPNYITNTVWLLSIIQNFSIEAVNHAGKPFHGSLLESQAFCFWASLSILFCVAMVLEVYPFINDMLQLAPMPSKSFQIFMLSLFAFDSCACFLADNLCVYFLNKRLWKEKWSKEKPADPNSELAADVEEHISQKERKQNLSFVRKMSLVAMSFIVKSLRS